MEVEFTAAFFSSSIRANLLPASSAERWVKAGLEFAMGMRRLVPWSLMGDLLVAGSDAGTGAAGVCS